MKSKIFFIMITVLFLHAETLFQVKDSSDRVVLDVSSDGLRVLNEGDTVMVISSSEIKAVIDNSKALSRSFSVATSTSAKGQANVLEVTTGSTTMREGTAGNQYTDFSPDNIFIGLNSGISSRPGQIEPYYGKYNTFLGNESGYSNTYGFGNIFIGYQAGYFSTTSNQNISIGYQAGYNMTGQSNTLVGHLVGKGTGSGGDYNSFYGRAAGFSIGSAAGNTLLGALAGSALTNGNSNTIVGREAGKGQTGAAFNYNTIMGSYAATQLSIGSRNVVLGYNAGGSISTGAGNVFIGYQSGSSETGSDKLYIENSNSSVPLIYGDFANDELTVNGTLSSGNFTSETTSGNNFLRVTSVSTSSPGIEFFRPGTGSYDWRIYNTSGNLRIGTSNDDLATVTDMFHIALGGNVGIGSTSPGQKLDIAGGNGRVESGYSWLTNSDARYKTNVSTLENSLANVIKMRGVRYDLKDESDIDQNNGKHIGFIAQELEEIYPEFVVEDENNYKSVSYDKVNAVLVEAIKEQQNKINDLEAENKQLLSRIESIEAILKK